MNLSINKQVSQKTYNKVMEILNKEIGISARPNIGATIYPIESDGAVASTVVDKTIYVEEVLNTGLYGITEEEAKSKVEFLKAVQRIKEYIATSLGEYTGGDRAVLYYNTEDKKFMYVREFTTKAYQLFGDIAAEHAEQLIKDCEADLKIVFNVK